ncbi:MAG: HEAT repeat domain-containing protein [Planctomycetota bacterium]
MKDQIRKYVSDLGADKWDVRERATEALIRIGPPAIPALKKALETGDPEVRLRAANILDQVIHRVPVSPRDHQVAVERGLIWLKTHQDAGGMWSCNRFMLNCKGGVCGGPGKKEAFDVGVTGLALLAFLWAGHTHKSGTHKEVVKSALKALKERQTPDGCFGQKTADGFWIYNHAIATLALAEAYGRSGKSLALQEMTQRAVDFLSACQNPYLGWRYGRAPGDNDTSCTAWASSALKTAGVHGLDVPKKCFEGTLNWLSKTTDEDTYWTCYATSGERPKDIPSPLRPEAMTAAAVAMRCFIHGERAGKRLEVLGGGNRLMKMLPTWNRQADAIDMYYWFWGTLACFRLRNAYWKAWSQPLRQAIVPVQKPTGCEKGSWDPVGRWGPQGGRVYATAINLLSLEVFHQKGTLTRGK